MSPLLHGIFMPGVFARGWGFDHLDPGGRGEWGGGYSLCHDGKLYSAEDTVVVQESYGQV